MQGDDVALASRQDIAEGHPAAASLTLQTRVDLTQRQQFQDILDPRAVIPDNADTLRQNGEELLGQPKLQRRSPVQGDDDLVHVGDVFQDLDDVLERRILQLRIEGGEDQCDRIGRGMPLQFLFQMLEIRLPEPVEHGNQPVLMKIRHSPSSTVTGK